MELQDSLQQSQELTNKLVPCVERAAAWVLMERPHINCGTAPVQVGIMNSFEGRLSSLEDGMASINNRTNQLKSIYSSVLFHLH